MDTEEINQDLKKEHQHKIIQVIEEVGKVVVGQKHMVNRLLIGLFHAKSHFIRGRPGDRQDPDGKYLG